MPALERGSDKKIAILSSHMGARNGGPTPTNVYGASKAALNDRYREIEPQWRARGIKSVIFHPGWVQTSMGGSGAWKLPFYEQDLFAKSVVIAGVCHPWSLRHYPKIPVWAFVTMFAVFWALKAMRILRVSAEEETAGLDVSEHGMRAYTSEAA